jgi:transcriptional regulator with XRE-family HTH domain
MQTAKGIIADIKREMILQDIPQKQMANELNMTQQALSNVFSRENPQLSTLLKICNYLKLKISIKKDDTK